MLLPVATGGLIWTTSWPGCGLLVFVCLVPLLVHVRRLRPARAFACGLLAAWIGYALTGHPVLPTLVEYYELGSMACSVVCVVMLVPMGLPLGVVCAFAARTTAGWPKAIALLLGAVAFAVTDAVAARWWIPSQAMQLVGELWPTPIWLQTADLFGSAGPAFLIGLVNLALASAVADVAAGRGFRAGRMPIAVTGLVLLAAAGYGLARQCAQAPPAVPLRVALCEEGRPAISELRSVGGQVDLIATPEAAFDVAVEEHAEWLAAAASVASHGDVCLLLGVVRPGSDSGRQRNCAVLISDRAPDWYDKRRLFPFAETFPLGRLDLLGRQRAGQMAFETGADSGVVAVGGVPVARVLCIELWAPDLIAEEVRSGAQAVIALCDSTAVLSPALADHAVAQTVLRAIENRVPVLQVDRSGRSLHVAADGRVASLPPAAEGVRAATLSPVPSWSFYSRTAGMQDRWQSAAAASVVMVTIAPSWLIRRAWVPRVKGRHRGQVTGERQKHATVTPV